jgi:hypothetical protein
MSNDNATRTTKQKSSLLTTCFTNGLDTSGTLSCDPTRGIQAQARGYAFGQSIVKFLLVMITSSLLLSINTFGAYAYKNHHMNLKLYAHNELRDYKQFDCYNRLIHKESSWNYKARNGSHYGLGQMRSTWYGTLTPRKQIKAHLRYIEHRYSTPCKAEQHFNKVGWH